ncbi:hypothetical protein PG994_000526 [Apiospora phragmitis]|uniref:2EXR domain-containing protein n=1 Tax=Apiospora phragmitis TaxID=2905665 RepID=A0ABR1X6M0_9PEZI
MDTFMLFRKLPIELRRQVWEQAIGHEATTRRVPVDDFAMCILPDASLVSPLLSTCQESRKAAKSYYCDPVPVHVCGPPEFRPIDLEENREEWEDVLTRINMFTATMFDDEVGPAVLAQYNLYHVNRQGKRVGTLRVSLESDTFVDGGRGLSREVTTLFLVPVALPAEWRPQIITPMLDDSQYNQVIRTMNDNRITLTSVLQRQPWIRRRLAPRHPAAVVGDEGPEETE